MLQNSKAMYERGSGLEKGGKNGGLLGNFESFFLAVMIIPDRSPFKINDD